MFLLMSCGKSGGGSGPASPEMQQEEVQPNRGPVDLLESMIDVNVSVTGDEILFRESKTSTARGLAIECATTVKGGDSYRYNVDGDHLEIFMSNGRKYTMKRLSEGSGLKGAWAWRGYEANRMYVILSLTVLDSTRIILKTHCEN
jgi:hypothetical protein